MFSLLKYLIRNAQPVIQPGANIDTRSPEQKATDIHFSEIVGMANPVNWAEKYPNKIRRFPMLNQLQTMMCGAFSLAKHLGINFFVKYGKYINFYPPDIYQRRTNKPSPGMMLYDMMRIASEGVTLADFFKMDYKNDEEADSIMIEKWHREVGKVFAVQGSVYIPSDIEILASVIQTTGKAPIMLMYFTSGEYSKEVPTIVEKDLPQLGIKTLRHFTVAPDFTLRKGVKTIYMEDSAHFGGLYERYLTEDWIKTRVVEIRYAMNFKFSSAVGDRPVYDGLTVVSAQRCLRFEGFFPMNVDFLENFGPLTKNAVRLFQQKYALPVTQVLDTATKNKLHQLFP